MTFTIRGNHYVPDMPAALYHSDPCAVPSLSPSIAKVLIGECEAHAYARHPRFDGMPWESTDEMDFGTLVHALLLGKDGDRIGVIYVEDSKTKAIVPAQDFRTNAAKDARDKLRAEGKTPVLQKHVDRARKLVNRAQAGLTRHGIDLSGGEAEVSIFWEATASNGAKVQCRCRLDWVKNALMRDLKTCDSAHPLAIQSSVDNQGYYIQQAANRQALTAVKPEYVGRTHYEWIFIEQGWPHCVNPSIPSGQLAAMGESEWQRAVDTWERCLRTNEWPEYSEPGVLSVVEPTRRMVARWEEHVYGER